MEVQDRLGRPLANLRVSVTDRCNLRCQYCMPEADYVWLPRNDILTFEEIERLVDVFAALGTDKVRITGGEPLLRTDLPNLVALLAGKAALRDLALTTNGILLAEHVAGLRDAGLPRITVSLDTLHPDRFKALTRFDRHRDVLRGLEQAAGAGFESVKIDTVVIRGVNDDELVAMLEYGRRMNAEVRFIEYMDVGGATRWSMEDVVSRREMLRRLSAHYGPIEAVDETTAAPADRFTLPDGTVFGIISSTTRPFCRGMRPQPSHRGRALVPLPLRAHRHRPAPAVAGRRRPRGPAGPHRDHLGGNATTAARRNAWPRPTAPPSSPSRRCRTSRTWRCTRAAAEGPPARRRTPAEKSPAALRLSPTDISNRCREEAAASSRCLGRCPAQSSRPGRVVRSVHGRDCPRTASTATSAG